MQGAPLPLARYPLIATSSLEQAAAAYASVGSPVAVEQLDRRTQFEWKSNLVSLGTFALSAQQHGGSIRATARRPAEQFSILLPINDVGGQAYERSSVRDVVALVKGRETFLSSPIRPQTITLGTGYRGLRVVFEKGAMLAALTALTGVTPKDPLRFEPRLSLESGAGATLERMAWFLARELEHGDSSLVGPILAARFGDLMISTLLLGQRHNYSAHFEKVGRPAEPRYVRLAAEHLASHAAEPLRMTEVAAKMGVSLRALQLGFHRHRGQSPSEFLRDRRLDLARSLLGSNDRPTVAEVARRCGFESMGHFSARYRARFGELPSHTATKAR